MEFISKSDFSTLKQQQISSNNQNNFDFDSFNSGAKPQPVNSGKTADEFFNNNAPVQQV